MPLSLKLLVMTIQTRYANPEVLLVIASEARQSRKMTGSPRRFAPRDDGGGGFAAPRNNKISRRVFSNEQLPFFS